MTQSAMPAVLLTPGAPWQAMLFVSLPVEGLARHMAMVNDDTHTQEYTADPEREWLRCPR